MERSICQNIHGCKAQGQLLPFPDGDLFPTDQEGALSRKTYRLFLERGMSSLYHQTGEKESIGKNTNSRSALGCCDSQVAEDVGNPL